MKAKLIISYNLKAAMPRIIKQRKTISPSYKSNFPDFEG